MSSSNNSIPPPSSFEILDHPESNIIDYSTTSSSPQSSTESETKHDDDNNEEMDSSTSTMNEDNNNDKKGEGVNDNVTEKKSPIDLLSEDYDSDSSDDEEGDDDDEEEKEEEEGDKKNDNKDDNDEVNDEASSSSSLKDVDLSSSSSSSSVNDVDLLGKDKSPIKDDDDDGDDDDDDDEKESKITTNNREVNLAKNDRKAASQEQTADLLGIVDGGGDNTPSDNDNNASSKTPNDANNNDNVTTTLLPTEQQPHPPPSNDATTTTTSTTPKNDNKNKQLNNDPLSIFSPPPPQPTTNSLLLIDTERDTSQATDNTTSQAILLMPQQNSSDENNHDNNDTENNEDNNNETPPNEPTPSERSSHSGPIVLEIDTEGSFSTSDDDHSISTRSSSTYYSDDDSYNETRDWIQYVNDALFFDVESMPQGCRFVIESRVWMLVLVGLIFAWHEKSRGGFDEPSGAGGMTKLDVMKAHGVPVGYGDSDDADFWDKSVGDADTMDMKYNDFVDVVDAKLIANDYLPSSDAELTNFANVSDVVVYSHDYGSDSYDDDNEEVEEVEEVVGGDLPVFWHVARNGGETMKDILAQCYKLVQASDRGDTESSPTENRDSLYIIKKASARYVNVDTTTLTGLSRAKFLDLTSSHLAQIIITPHLHATNQIFTSPHLTKGRLFTLFRHPVERAVSLYHHIQDSDDWIDPEMRGLTLEAWAYSRHVPENEMTRRLVDKPVGELTRVDFEKAKSILKQKCLVGLMDEWTKSLLRFQVYFGWTLDTTGQNCRNELIQRRYDEAKRNKIKEGGVAWSALMVKNTFDVKVYNYVKVLFKEQSVYFKGKGVGGGVGRREKRLRRWRRRRRRMERKGRRKQRKQ